MNDLFRKIYSNNLSTFIKKINIISNKVKVKENSNSDHVSDNLVQEGIVAGKK